MKLIEGARRPAGRFRWLAPVSALLFVAVLALGSLTSALAAGETAESAIAVGADGRFQGTTPAGPDSDLWYRFRYEGSGTPANITVEYQPADSNRFDLELYTGTPTALRQESSSAVRTDNQLRISFVDPETRDVFIRLINMHSDRAVSFVGSIEPTSVLEAPGSGTPTATAGPVATDAAAALMVDADGDFQGTLSNARAVWWKFYYGNPGASAAISASISPDADNTTLDVYTTSGTDLVKQSGDPVRTGDTLSRTVQLATAQFVYFTVVNNKAEGLTVAYAGRVNPIGTPPGTPAATASPTATGTPVAATATTVPSQPSPTPQAAPPVPHDTRYFVETQYRIDNDAIYSFFVARGGIDTFGYPVSRTFTFLGCPVQVFQRLIIQLCQGQSPALINLLDPDIFPYTRVNQSVFPGPDDQIKNRTPQVGTPDYGDRILQFVRDTAPETFEGEPVNFGTTFFSTGGLETWGAPISSPARDPGNANFIYQRFQRGIMHYTRGQGTRGILLADYLKAILRDRDVPPDLREQSRSSRYFAQYCPGAEGWLCRPADLPGTNLTFAFEQG